MKKNKKEKIIRDNANKIRAEIIGYAIEVEDALTEDLGTLYCPDRKSIYVTLLINDIISELTFDKKIKIFKKFVNLSPESFDHQTSIIKDLNEIREKRNQLAHRKLSFPWVFDENDIDENDFNFLTKEYINWKEKCDFDKAGKETFSFSVKELEEYKSLCKWTKTSIYLALNNLLFPDDKKNNATSNY